MKCWICDNEMQELQFVKGDFICKLCGGQYTKKDNHYVFLDKNDNHISNPIFKNNK